MIALQISLIIILFLVITLLILHCIKSQNKSNKNNENFVSGMGTSFSQYFNPIPDCHPDQGCARGFTARFAAYQNMCAPKSLDPYGNERPESNRLLKDKIHLNEYCIRYLE